MPGRGSVVLHTRGVHHQGRRDPLRARVRRRTAVRRAVPHAAHGPGELGGLRRDGGAAGLHRADLQLPGLCSFGRRPGNLQAGPGRGGGGGLPAGPGRQGDFSDRGQHGGHGIRQVCVPRGGAGRGGPVRAHGVPGPGSPGGLVAKSQRPKLFIAAEGDRSAQQAAAAYYEASPEESGILEIYTGSDHGTNLLEGTHGAQVTGRLLEFLEIYSP